MIDINIWELIKGIFEMFLKFWWLWIMLGVLIFLRLLFERLIPDWIDKQKNKMRFKTGQKWRSDRDLLRWLRGMEPSEFENYIANLFQNLGYKTKTTGGFHDKGIDAVAEKDGIKYYIQCKKFITSEVTIHDVRDFYGALADHLANGKGYFITTNRFTLEAEKFADDKPIELIDGFRLIEYIRLAEKNNKGNKTEVCPKCGGKLQERIGKYGKFYGCSNYPKCQYTENIKK